VIPPVDAGVDAPKDAPPDAPAPPDSGCHDTQSDPHNCGKCGHDCQGGACVMGVCQPVLMTDDELFPHTLAADDARVYWANVTDVDYGDPPASILVRSMPATAVGGTPVTLDTVTPGYPTSLHRDGKYLYFYRSIEWTIVGQPFVGTVFRLCADGSCKSVDLSGPVDNYKWEIAIDPTTIFFPASKNGGMALMQKGGGAPTSVLTYPGFFFARLVVDDSFVYAVLIPNLTLQETKTPFLARVGKTEPGALVPLVQGLVEGGDVAVDAQNVYFSDVSHVYRLPKSDATTATPTPITPDGLHPGFLASDADRVYWLEQAAPDQGLPASVHWARKDGGAVGSIALTTEPTAGVAPVVNETSIFWATTLAPLTPPHPPRGGIMKVVKPL
jgi:hypothetical protein